MDKDTLTGALATMVLRLGLWARGQMSGATRDFALTVEDRHSSCLSRHLVNLLTVNTTVSSALQYLCEMRTSIPEM